MRSDDPNPAARTAWARLRARLEPARRWLIHRGPGPRLALLLAPLGLLVAAACYFAAEEPVRREWLYDGHRFAAEDAARVEQALKARKIEAVVSDGKVGVPAAIEAEALALLGKAGLAPRSAEEIARDEPERSIIDPPEVRKHHELHQRGEAPRADDPGAGPRGDRVGPRRGQPPPGRPPSARARSPWPPSGSRRRPTAR